MRYFVDQKSLTDDKWLPLTFDAKADDMIVGIDGSGMKVSNVENGYGRHGA